MNLVCSECGRPAAEDAMFCASCEGLLAFETFAAAPNDAPDRDRIAARRNSSDPRDRSGVWRYRELLPDIPREAIVTLREGDVPLYGAPRAAEYAGMRRLAYLHLGMNPTASFKDAGMTVAISRARATGSAVAICASTGNTSASLAAYAARARIAAVVLVPSTGISASKVAQTLDYGATVVAIDGDFDAALVAVRAMDPQRVAIVNSVNPYRIEGQKTAAFILLEARSWRVPDWIVLPGGNLGNTSAIGKGLREMLALGWIDRLPRLAVVQAAGAAPFARAFRDKADLIPVHAETTATAIKIGAPASWKKARAEVAASNGTVLAVEDDEIADARAIVGRDGVGSEPASAATLAGLRRLVADGTIGAGDDVVLLLTGHVLKDGAYAANYHESAAAFANPILRGVDLAEVIDRLNAPA
ncbi:MAG TPA: threonine synthase [Candidatus Lustribacter sp.]|nr:threonine synthase [Candidatus Lustribacter sp.]